MNSVLGFFGWKPFSGPEEKVRNVEGFEMTPEMQKSLNNYANIDETDLATEAFATLLDKGLNISTTGLMNTLVEKVFQNTVPGKILSALITVADAGNTVTGLNELFSNDADEQYMKKFLLFGYTLAPNSNEANMYFGNLKMQAGFSYGKHQMNQLSLEEALSAATINGAFGGSSMKKKAFGIKASVSANALGNILLKEFCLASTVVTAF